MKQEPVAWLCQNIDGNYDALSDKTCIQCFPVYTSPQYKELSDAEIEEWLDIYGLDMGDVYEITQVRFVQAVRAIIKSAEVLK